MAHRLRAPAQERLISNPARHLRLSHSRAYSTVPQPRTSRSVSSRYASRVIPDG